MNKIFLLLCLISAQSYAEFSSGGSEGVSIKSTGVANGLVLKANGSGSSIWDSVSGTGDVVGPSSSIDKSIVTASGNTGKAIDGAPGSDADNNVIVDFTSIGEQFYLKADLDAALTYLVSNASSGPSARSITSYGTDLGVNVFSVGAHSSNHSFFPSTAVWASHFDNGSAFSNTQAGASTHFYLAGTSILELVGTSGITRITGLSETNKVEISPNTANYITATNDRNGTVMAEFNNSNSGSSAYSEIDINSNAGILFFGHSSSGVSGTWIQGDQAYVVSNDSNGMMIGTQGTSAPIKFIVGGSTSDKEVMRLKPHQVNIPLADYANDAAAGLAGLITGDLYQTSGTVKVKQ